MELNAGEHREAGSRGQPEDSRRKAKSNEADLGPRVVPNDEAAVLRTPEEGGTIWQSVLKLKGAAGDKPKDLSPTCLKLLSYFFYKLVSCFVAFVLIN